MANTKTVHFSCYSRAVNPTDIIKLLEEHHAGANQVSSVAPSDQTTYTTDLIKLRTLSAPQFDLEKPNKLGVPTWKSLLPMVHEYALLYIYVPCVIVWGVLRTRLPKAGSHNVKLPTTNMGQNNARDHRFVNTCILEYFMKTYTHIKFDIFVRL